MAMESQGVEIRRISTIAASTGSTFATTISWSSATKQILDSNIAADFVTAGFSTGMRLYSDSTVNTGLYTISAVAATAITIYEPCTDQAAGATITVTGNVFVPIGQVKSFTGPSGAAGIIDITNLASTAKEKLVALRDEGQVSMDVFLDLANATAMHIALKDDRAARELRKFDIKLTDESTTAGSQPSALNFSAYVTNYSIAGSVDNAVTASITLEITSAITWIAKV